MNIWEKLTNDPDRGPLSRSPLAFLVLGLGLLFFDLHTIVTDTIKLGKRENAPLIHFADHPKTLFFTFVWVTLIAIFSLKIAREKYLKHDQ